MKRTNCTDSILQTHDKKMRHGSRQPLTSQMPSQISIGNHFLPHKKGTHMGDRRWLQYSRPSVAVIKISAQVTVTKPTGLLLWEAIIEEPMTGNYSGTWQLKR